MRSPLSALRAACGALVTLGLVACEAPTDAPRRIHSDIFDIEVPSAVRATDSLTVAFRYQIHCGSIPNVDVQVRDAAVTVAVWQPVSDQQVVCQGIYRSARTEIVVSPESRAAGPTTVRFRQASGADSVRVVSTLSASTRAP